MKGLRKTKNRAGEKQMENLTAQRRFPLSRWVLFKEKR